MFEWFDFSGVGDAIVEEKKNDKTVLIFGAIAAYFIFV